MSKSVSVLSFSSAWLIPSRTFDLIMQEVRIRRLILVIGSASLSEAEFLSRGQPGHMKLTFHDSLPNFAFKQRLCLAQRFDTSWRLSVWIALFDCRSEWGQVTTYPVLSTVFQPRFVSILKQVNRIQIAGDCLEPSYPETPCCLPNRGFEIIINAFTVVILNVAMCILLPVPVAARSKA